MKILLILVFIIGLILDLSTGNTLGKTSLFFLLLVGIIIFSLSKFNLPKVKI